MLGDTTHALLLGRAAQEGETVLAVLPVAATAFGAVTSSGALALTDRQLWLAQPQLLGGPSVAAVPRADLDAVLVSERRRAGRTAVRVELVVRGRRSRFATPDRAAAEAFAALAAPPG